MAIRGISIETAAQMISQNGAGSFEDVRAFILDAVERQRALVRDIQAGKIVPREAPCRIPGSFARRQAQP